MAEVNASDEKAQGYLALPDSGEGRGVIVLHAWWGLSDFFKQFCERLASEGFVAFAPDLYHGVVATTIDQAEQLSSALDREAANQEMVAAVEHLRGHTAVNGHSLGIVGFSLGAFLALWLAQNRPTDIGASVLFYGTGDGKYNKTRAAFLAHFAENDPYEPPKSVQKLENDLRAAGRDMTFYTYPGTGHWFFETDQADAYNDGAAQLAWARTVKFLREHLE